MRDAGYVYVNIDDTWEAQRDATGVLHSASTPRPDPRPAPASRVRSATRSRTRSSTHPGASTMSNTICAASSATSCKSRRRTTKPRRCAS
jgi:hypothetical protein